MKKELNNQIVNLIKVKDLERFGEMVWNGKLNFFMSKNGLLSYHKAFNVFNGYDVSKQRELIRKVV